MNQRHERAAGPACDIAIIGLAGRFPGAPDVRRFWDNLCAGVESIAHFTDAQLEDAFDAAVRSRPNFVRARSVLEGVDAFDAGFFGMQSREADLTDPQHRVFLECCWEALEDAGYDPGAYAGAIGVLAGCSINSYFLRNVLSDRQSIEQFTSDYQVGSYAELVGAGHDFLATRVAYKLDLRGPAMTVQSACSTSLATVAAACQHLIGGQADIMLAGAVSITFPQQRGYLYAAGGMVSPDGHCRTFDAAANGTVFGAGAGVVVLRRLDDALAAGDTIYARIRGFGVTNDGAAKIGYTAPSSDGQARAIAAAQAMAGVAARDIGYVECHGTGTPLGDPIEFAALVQAFGADCAPRQCALGSVKTNVGHLDVAAGMTSLIKTALAIYHGKIPPTLHYTTPNPRIPIDGSPFFVNTQLGDWRGPATDRRAGVSAFGVGGTNVHLVLEAAPARPVLAAPVMPQAIVVSARTPAALAVARANLRAYFATADAAEFGAAAFTLQAGRRAFAHRFAVVAADPAEAARKLGAPDSPAPGASGSDTGGGVAFMFPGQGAQYAGMGRELYDRLPVFRAAIERCAAILAPLVRIDLRDLLYADATDRETLQSTELAQPAIFCIEYALAAVWIDWGIVPTAMIGHSVGEFVAACLAGVMTLEDALFLVAERGRLMRSLPGGAMLAVRLPAAELAPWLDAASAIAAVNGPALCVAAGPYESIAALERRLAQRDVLFRRLDTSHAFHSPMVEPIVAPLAERVAGVPLTAPSQAYVSSTTGDWISAGEATSPEYWARHCREPVRFAAGLDTLVAAGITTLLEVGPGSALGAFARQGAAKSVACTITGSLPGATHERGDLETMLESLALLWAAGVEPNWAALHPAAERRRLPLPAYPFERKRHWIDAAARPANAAPIELQPAAARPALERNSVPNSPQADVVSEPSHTAQALIEARIAGVLEDLSGEDIGGQDPASTFLTLGFDSLSLGRFAGHVQTQFGVSVTFRQLLGELPSIRALAAHILAIQPAQPAPAVAPSVSVAPAEPAEPVPGAPAASGGATPLAALMREQLAAMQALMRDQLAALGQAGHAAAPSAPVVATVAAPEAPSRFEVFRPGPSVPGASDLTDRQREHIADLIARTTARTARSKALTQAARAVLADPRVAAGFRSEWKEMVYPLVCDRAQGSRLWDVDGNEYIDLLNGFGQTAFGHSPDFVVAAVAKQLERGFPIGPQTELAGEVAELFCKLTGNARVTFCNTGSEAVMAALRLARTVTGRDRVVIFNGAYHGQFDEVLVKGARTSHRALPVAPGIPRESVANMTVLSYGTPDSLEWIREHATELAAVVVEPVQSRHPALVPTAFLHELRAITAASGTALVFDEVVTGFRVHPGGMQAVFGIRADLATYGKVVGGGMPIGILAGTTRFMDALDGGMWQYGDDSIPEVAPTFFAGTFVRHPLVMAAVLAVLRHLDAAGPALQIALSARTAGLVARLNALLEAGGLESRIENYGSLFYFNFTAHERLAGLLYYHLRERGIYIQEGFPCFLTTAHSAADVDAIVAAFESSLAELAGAGIFAVPEIPVHSVALTEEQTEIWLAAQLSDEASCAFNESVTLRLRGELDVVALSAAWKTVINRHDALRATLHPTGEAMKIAARTSFRLTPVDLSTLDPLAAEAALSTAVERDARLPFDMVDGPLVRAQLLRLGESEHALLLTAHHIICDGWSMNVMLGEFAEAYAAHVQARTPDLAHPLQFSTYARMQHERDRAEFERLETYWLSMFAEPVRPLELPTDRSRPRRKSFAGATRSARIDAAHYGRIKKAGARNGCTLFTTLLAGFATLAGRLADQTDVVVGVPAAGQSLLEDAVLVGHCVDFLPIRTRWTADASLRDVLTTVRRNVLDAYEHQSYTLGTLVRTLDVPREIDRLPLTDIQFNLERLADGVVLPGLDVQVEPNAKAFVNFDLFLNVIESEAGLRLDCDYSTDLFDAATIDRWLTYYVAMLDAFVADADTPAARVSILSPIERRHILADANATSDVGFGETTLGALFEERAAAQPDAPALTAGRTTLTYGALDARANALAHYLRSRIAPSDLPIGICVERGADAVVALLATLKAGRAYIPLDPTHPVARLRHIVDDSEIGALVTDVAAGVELAQPGIPVIHLGLDADAIAAAPQTLPFVARHPDRPAYIIYTSGSSGRPKGVEVTHRSVVNLLCAMSREPGLAPADVLLAVTTLAFDIAALEVFLPLVVGAHVVMASSEATTDAHALIALMGATGVTVMQATPSTWRMMLEAGFVAPPGFKMLVGGEALSRELADRLLAGAGELWNMYGPTETTIWSSCCRIASDAGPITVGRPILNTQFYVLDANDEPVPVGAIGELHIAGAGVARGYVKRPELNARKFIANPFGPGRMYRTGDAARLLPSGAFAILGRLDDQIKLRGFRIELGEIEAVLAQQANLAACAVALREDTLGESRLVAYFVERPEWPQTAAALRALAAEHLPEYMIPALWMRLPALPLSANGKLDRAALPVPDAAAREADTYAAPRTATELTLAAIWAEILPVERVGIDDDIFSLGADSIHIFRITARANKAGLPLAAKQLMRHRTIAALGAYLDGLRPAVRATNGVVQPTQRGA